ncbi:MAG: hypothetical protein ACI9EK_002836 [Psychroserpens sp.]|jgi:hypothetical protein
MLVVFAAYWAFFTWFLTDSIIATPFYYIFAFAIDFIRVILELFIELNPNSPFVIDNIIPNFPGFLGFIVAFICTIDSRGFFED